jgi:flagellar basal body-associated protein FliL
MREKPIYTPIIHGTSLCAIKKPRERGGHSLRWAAEPEKILLLLIIIIIIIIIIIAATLYSLGTWFVSGIYV